MFAATLILLVIAGILILSLPKTEDEREDWDV